MLKVAIYSRLSDEDKNKVAATDDSESIQNQKDMLLEYAAAHQWVVYATYSDDDYTGADRNRPDFQRLLKDAEDRKFDIILCKTQSRFTRELELVEKYLHHLFPLWGIRFVSIVDNADTAIKGNKKSRQINGLVNEWYLEDLSENIKGVFNTKQRKGTFIGSFAPYGYQKDPQRKGHLIVDAEAQAVVYEIFSLFANGHGKTAIARILNDRGVLSPSAYKKLHYPLFFNPNATRYGLVWTLQTVSQILTNQVYRGHMVQGKFTSISYKTRKTKGIPKDQWIVVERTHEPIIDESLWDTVQVLLKQHSRPYKGGDVGVFSRKTKCLYCGHTLKSRITEGKRYFQCMTKFVSAEECKGAFISLEALETAILKELQSINQKYLDETEILQQVQFNNNSTSKLKKLQGDLEAYQKNLAETTKTLKVLYIDKTKGILSESDFIQLNQELSKDKERLEGHITTTKKNLDDLLRIQQVAQDHKKRIEEYTQPKRLTREMVVSLIDHVVIGKKDRKTKQIPMEIQWNF